MPEGVRGIPPQPVTHMFYAKDLSVVPTESLRHYSPVCPCDMYVCVCTTPGAMRCKYVCTPSQGRYTLERIKLVVLDVLSSIELGGLTYFNNSEEVLDFMKLHSEQLLDTMNSQ